MVLWKSNKNTYRFTNWICPRISELPRCYGRSCSISVPPKIFIKSQSPNNHPFCKNTIPNAHCVLFFRWNWLIIIVSCLLEKIIHLAMLRTLKNLVSVYLWLYWWCLKILESFFFILIVMFLLNISFKQTAIMLISLAVGLICIYIPRCYILSVHRLSSLCFIMVDIILWQLNIPPKHTVSLPWLKSNFSLQLPVLKFLLCFREWTVCSYFNFTSTKIE